MTARPAPLPTFRAPLIDSHAHLHDQDFDADRPAVLARARAAGLEAIVTIGTDLEESRRALALAEAEPDVYATVGLHPASGVEAWPNLRNAFAALAASPRVVAIGEIGLDYYWDRAPRDVQRARFEDQLALARDLHLPVVIHSREAHADTSATLAAWAPTASLPAPIGVLHCFSGDAALAMRYVELGFAISFAGPVTYPKNDALRAAARVVPAERLVVETDCPYLTPQFRRGARNEPAYVAETLRCIAEERGLPPETLAAQTTATTRSLFRLPAQARISP